METLETIKEFLKPELLILIPVCYFIGTGLVKSNTVKNTWIPIILGSVGVVLSALYVLATVPISNYMELLMALFTAITQGVLVAGCSVYINQLIKQSKKAKEV